MVVNLTVDLATKSSRCGGVRDSGSESGWGTTRAGLNSGESGGSVTSVSVGCGDGGGDGGGGGTSGSGSGRGWSGTGGRFPVSSYTLSGR